MNANGNGDGQPRAAASHRLTTKATATAATAVDRQLHRSHLQKLNEVMSVATRRVFQSPLLLEHSLTDPSAIRQQLPELCAFVDALSQVSTTATNDTSVAGSAAAADKSVQRNAAIVRRVFRDPDAQWLTRSAMQSGASALLCGQLLRCAEEHFAAQQSLAAANLVVLLLCDQLLTPCTLRLGAFSRNCEWRDRKPAYHAMPCFATWDTLFPFLDRMAKRFPRVCTEVFATYKCETRRQDMPTRVNCNFAHVVGLWRLMESLGGGSGSTTQGLSIPVQVAGGQSGDSAAMMLSLLDSVLQFTVRSSMLEVVASRENPNQDSADDVKSAAFYDDLLMDKFFSGLQEFMFSCPRSKTIARHALQSAIVDSIVAFTNTQGLPNEDPDSVLAMKVASRTVPAGLAMLAGVSCLFVKGLANSIVTSLLTSLRSSTAKSLVTNPLLLFIVGFCAHVDLVPISSVLESLSALLDMYAFLDTSSQEVRIQAVFFIVYVAIYRTDAVTTLRSQYGDASSGSYGDGSGSGDDDSVGTNPYLGLLNFQDRFTGEVESEHFYALPVEWMALFWKEWFAFSEDDLTSFISGYEDHQQQRQEGQISGGSSEELHAVSIVKRLQDKQKEAGAQIAFRDVDGVFVKQMQLLRPHFITPSYIDTLLLGSSQSEEEEDGSSLKRLLSESLYGTQQHLKNKKQRRALAPADLEAEERKLNVLMLPEVMEKVCSFMSAKRLCRLAVVCQAFAEISRSSRLWQQLYSSLAVKDLKPVSCNHEASYQHDWRTMYRERWDARKKLRKRQRAVNTTHQRLLLVHDPESIDITTGTTTTTELLPAEPFTVRLCHFCGCHRMLSSQSQTEEHLKTHRQFKCEVESSCDATFPSLAQLKKHIKQLHPSKEDPSGAAAVASRAKKKPRIDCGFAGCTRSYTSAKRLETHRKLENHYV